MPRAHCGHPGLTDEAGERHEEDGEAAVDHQRGDDAAARGLGAAQAAGEDDRGGDHHRGADRRLQVLADVGEGVVVGDLQHRRRPALFALPPEVDRHLQDQDDEVADRDGPLAGAPAQPARGEGVEEVDDHRQRDRGDDEADRDQARDTGVRKAGGEPGETAGDDQRAHPVARPARPGEEAGEEVEQAVGREEVDLPDRGDRAVGHQRRLDPGEQQRGGEDQGQRRAEHGAAGPQAPAGHLGTRQRSLHETHR